MDCHIRDHLHPPIRVSGERVALLGGAGLLAMAMSPGGRAAADASLTAHMVQHVLLLQIVPLLIVSGWPIKEDRRDSTCTSGGRLALVAWFAGVCAMTLWYAPPLFEWMMRSPLHHAAAQATLVLAGLLFWSPVFARRANRRLPAGPAVAYLFTACVASTLAGASIAFAAPGLYGGHATSAFDQQIAGLVMWLPCCVVYVAAIMTTLARWYGGDSEGDDKRTRVAPSEA
jgi:putative membrane protein